MLLSVLHKDTSWASPFPHFVNGLQTVIQHCSITLYAVVAFTLCHAVIFHMNHIIFNVSAPCDEHTTAKMLYVALSYIYYM